MAKINIEEYLEFINELADSAGKIAKKYFRNLDGFITKSDLTPVTIADREIEEIIREKIRSKYKNHGIIGEEFGQENEMAEYQWVIDPIDGTQSFIAGKPLFTTLIALNYQNKPILGLIDQPIIGDRWVGVTDEYSLFGNKKIIPNKAHNLKDAVLATTGPDWLRADILSKFNNLSTKVHKTIYGGDAYNYGLLASGYIDIIVETGLKPHDFCALAPVIKGAGYFITDFKGQELNSFSEGNVIATRSKELQDITIDIISR